MVRLDEAIELCSVAQRELLPQRELEQLHVRHPRLPLRRLLGLVREERPKERHTATRADHTTMSAGAAPVCISEGDAGAAHLCKANFVVCDALMEIVASGRGRRPVMPSDTLAGSGGMRTSRDQLR